MATEILPQTIVHPMWEAVEARLRNEERWNLRAQGLPGGYHDWEIALAACVAGFGADVIVTDRDADGQPKAYEFPDRLIPVNFVEFFDTRTPLQRIADALEGRLKVDAQCEGVIYNTH